MVPSRQPRPLPPASAVRPKANTSAQGAQQAAFDAAFAWLRVLEQKYPRHAPGIYRRARESMGILAAVEATARALGEV